MLLISHCEAWTHIVKIYIFFVRAIYKSTTNTKTPVKIFIRHWGLNTLGEICEIYVFIVKTRYPSNTNT